MAVISVRHTTIYRYAKSVELGEHRLMFRPRDSWDQRLLDSSLTVTPTPVSIRWVHEVFGNCVTVVSFAARTKELRFESTIRLVHSPAPPYEFPIAEHAQTYPFSYDAEEMPDLLRSIERRYPDPHNVLYHWSRQFVNHSGRISTHALLASITDTINAQFEYRFRAEEGVQDPLATLDLRSGSCRDFAILMMEAVRSLGLAARFVSGYLNLGVADGRKRVGGGYTHAWVQVYIPGAGWMEFDPTNGILGSRDLIRVAVARDPIQAVPIWGSYSGSAADSLGLSVEVDITRDAVAASALPGVA